MDVRTHEEIGAIRDLAPAWREVAALDPSATAFQDPSFVFEWWEEFGAYRQLALMEIRDGGRIRAVAPMSLEPGGALRFSGDPSITDYCGPVCAPSDRDPVAAAVVQAGLGLGARRLELHGLAADSGWPEAFARAAKEAGLTVDEVQEDVCPRVAIPGDYDSYLASIPGKQRHEIRRKSRRLAEAGAWAVRVSDEASLDADLGAFFGMHLASDGPKGKFLDAGMMSFFRRLGHALAREGALRLTVLEAGGEPLAAIYGWVRGDVWSVYNSAYDHSKRSLSPGMVLVAETIRLAAGEGAAVFDFLRGAEEYKYRFGAVDLPVVKVVASAE